MIRKSIRRFLGPNGVSAVSSGRETLRRYPQYLLGDGRAGPPERLYVEMTYRCNLRCRMCPIYGEQWDDKPRPDEGSEARELTTAELKSLIEQAADMGVRNVTFTGGEPLLRKDVYEVIAQASRRGLQTAVISNGSVGGEEIAGRLIDSGLDQLSISIDGPAEVHDFIRRSPGLFDRIERNVQTLRAVQARRGANRPGISINCTVSALNQGRLHELGEVAARWKSSITFAPMFFLPTGDEVAGGGESVGAWVKPEDWRLPARLRQVDPEAVDRDLKQARLICREAGVPMADSIGGLNDIRLWFYDHAYARNNKCLYPWSSVRVSPGGEVYPCSIEAPVGHLREGTFAEIWNGPKYQRFRRRLRRAGLFPGCAKCCALNRWDVVCRMLPRFAFAVNSTDV